MILNIFDIIKNKREKKMAEVEVKHVPRIIFTTQCISAIKSSFADDISKKREAIGYLTGLTDGINSLAVGILCPPAKKTSGSFYVDQPSMAKVVRTAANFRLHVVGQVHTHPYEAFHSEGDENGARIRYNGYFSLVIPEYGRYLPALKAAAAFMFMRDRGFIKVNISEIKVVHSGAIQL